MGLRKHDLIRRDQFPDAHEDGAEAAAKPFGGIVSNNQGNGVNLNGDYDATMHIFSVSLRQKFGG